MAFEENGTKIADLFNPQVVGDMIEAELDNYIRFAPLAVIDRTLVATPGNTITVPKWSYIGAAATLNEGAGVTYAKLEADDDDVTVHKIAKGIELSDEAILSGYGDPAGEAVKQLTMSIADALDNEIVGVLASIGSDMTHYTGSTTFDPDDDINDALILFGEKLEGQKVLIVTSTQYAVLRKASAWIPASEIAAEAMVRGVVGEIYGCSVVISDRIAPSGENPAVAYIVKPGALRVFLKRDTFVETARDIDVRATKIVADKHEVCYLYDESKAIKIVLDEEPDDDAEGGGGEGGGGEGGVVA